MGRGVLSELKVNKYSILMVEIRGYMEVAADARDAQYSRFESRLNI